MKAGLARIGLRWRGRRVHLVVGCGVHSDVFHRSGAGSRRIGSACIICSSMPTQGLAIDMDGKVQRGGEMRLWYTDRQEYDWCTGYPHQNGCRSFIPENDVAEGTLRNGGQEWSLKQDRLDDWRKRGGSLSRSDVFRCRRQKLRWWSICASRGGPVMLRMWRCMQRT